MIVTINMLQWSSYFTKWEKATFITGFADGRREHTT